MFDWKKQEIPNRANTSTMEKINLLSLFSGMGAFEKALENLNIPYNLVNYCEIDKYASKAFSLIHNVPEEKNLVDVTKVDTSKIIEKVDLITYGFPCQDISIAGKMRGFVNEQTGETTRSGLFFEALRIIKDLQPKYAIAENVKNLTGNGFKEEFAIVLKSLEDIGYVNYWKVLNAKDYGIPQNRERVFIISIRKDLDDFRFRFPQPIPLKYKLLDLIEDRADSKYYLEGNRVNILKDMLKKKYNITSKVVVDSSIKNPKIKEVSNCITARYDAGIQNQESMGGVVVEPNSNDLSVRKFTPRECFRIMGFTDRDVDILISNGLANTRLYKMAGNSIAVNVLEEIFKKLLKS